jgi:hypothetical protein
MLRTPSLALGAIACAAALLLPSLAAAHPERPSYWPDPAAEDLPGGPSSGPLSTAGGEVPRARSLRSAATGKGAGDVRVVCKSNSLKLAERAIAKANRRGFRLRPSQPRKRLSDRKAGRLLEINRALAQKCRFRTVQKAVNRSGNNDRVVIMPGRYRENPSRQTETNDPACTPGLLQTQANGSPAPSFEYQATCPNDQNLIYVQGRAVAGEPTDPPLDNRQGIPAGELGECVRCNLQIEGSGPRPENVTLDAGKNYPDQRITSPPGGEEFDCVAVPEDCYTKHVVLRADRADGFVAKNLLTLGGREFGIYTEEIDGYLLDRTKFFWNADYGQLSFTSDHGLMRNCDGFGSGDSVVYPGASPETGAQADTSFYPDAPRINTTVTRCDLRGSALGYSGSMGNAVRITDNHIYGNTTGIASDTLSAGGHPGFPADSSEIDNNLIYSNNLDLYDDAAPVHPLVPVPIGTGVIYPGMNDARVHDNWIFDNWRNGTMLFAVPDAIVNGGGPEGNVNPGIACPGAPTVPISTSCGNEYFGNHMGQKPPGFRFPKALDQFGAPHAAANETVKNGNDFWWDEFLTNIGNCWYDNTGHDGTAATVTGPGTGTPPDLLPSDCATSVGGSDLIKEAYLLDCSNGPNENDPFPPDSNPATCDWWTQALNPQSPAAKRNARSLEKAAREHEPTAEDKALEARIESLAGVEDEG